MRTTVTLDPDVQALLKKFMRAKDISFKQALNDAVRQSARVPSVRAAPFVQRTFNMGQALVDVTKANALAGELEDLELLARMQRKP